MIDKNNLKSRLEDKDYSKCIVILFDEIKSILINKVKEKNPNYVYKTIGDLKNQSIRYLPTDLQSYSIALYTLVMQPEDETFELNLLLNIYEELCSEKIST